MFSSEENAASDIRNIYDLCREDARQTGVSIEEGTRDIFALRQAVITFDPSLTKAISLMICYASAIQECLRSDLSPEARAFEKAVIDFAADDKSDVWALSTFVRAQMEEKLEQEGWVYGSKHTELRKNLNMLLEEIPAKQGYDVTLDQIDDLLNRHTVIDQAWADNIANVRAGLAQSRKEEKHQIAIKQQLRQWSQEWLVPSGLSWHSTPQVKSLLDEMVEQLASERFIAHQEIALKSEQLSFEILDIKHESPENQDDTGSCMLNTSENIHEIEKDRLSQISPCDLNSAHENSHHTNEKADELIDGLLKLLREEKPVESIDSTEVTESAASMECTDPPSGFEPITPAYTESTLPAKKKRKNKKNKSRKQVPSNSSSFIRYAGMK